MLVCMKVCVGSIPLTVSVNSRSKSIKHSNCLPAVLIVMYDLAIFLGHFQVLQEDLAYNLIISNYQRSKTLDISPIKTA